jgi:hypothetical protein
MCQTPLQHTTGTEAAAVEARLVKRTGHSTRNAASTAAEAAPTSSSRKSAPASPWLARALRLGKWCLILAALAELAVIAWMITTLAVAGAGKDGEVVAVADEVKTIVPQHFKGLQQSMAYFGGFYTNENAKAYFEQQKPFFEAAAANFSLHRYFSTMKVPGVINWNNMIHERIKAFAALQTAEGRDDFRVEKDRCAMYEFFKNNDLRIVEVLGQWKSQQEFVSQLADGSVAKLAQAWPLFVKACHLTQSSSKGTKLLKSPEALQQQVKDNSLAEWVDAKWKFRAHDFERVWVNEGDQLTDSLQPSMLIQGPFVQPGHAWEAHGRYAVGLLEFRVEVMWGRAYLAQLDGCILFFRDGQVEDYSTPWGFLKIPVREKSAKVQWIQDEGYMACLWELAERAAKATATEYVRIDMFLKRGDPNGCTINENSLSSGLLYWGHEDYLAQTWAAGHQAQKYQMLASDKPVYELTPQDTPQ